VALTFGRGFSSKVKRIIVILLFFLIAIAATLAGVLTPLSAQEIDDRNSQLSGLQQDIKNLTIVERTGAILKNNLVICLLMFVPVGGPVFGLYALYNTGVFIAAQSLSYGAPPVLVLLLLFVFPFTWLEFAAYSTALSESFWFIRRILQGHVVRELKNTGILILISMGLLALGAVVEALMI